MDLRKLKTLIDLVSESNISELEITEADGKVRIVKADPHATAPSYVIAPPAARPVADVTHALLAEKQPLVRFSSPESIAAMAVFLCGTAASTITGAALSIDGGWTAR